MDQVAPPTLSYDRKVPLSRDFPDLAALDLFASVVSEGTLGRAAKVHGISQPSATSRIKVLETKLGVTLLDRSPSGSVPTATGVLVAQWAASILSAASEMEAGLAALATEASGRLRIVASYTIAEYLLPGWLHHFLQGRPSDSVALNVANSTQVIEHLRHGDAELGFIESPAHTDGFEEKIVAHDRMVTVVAPNHPWASARSVTLAELAETPLVLREEGSGTRAALRDELLASGLQEPTSLIALGSTAAVRAAVLNGDSPTVISRLAVRTEIEQRQLVEVEVLGLNIERDLRAVWPKSRPLNHLAQELLDSLDR